MMKKATDLYVVEVKMYEVPLSEGSDYRRETDQEYVFADYASAANFAGDCIEHSAYPCKVKIFKYEDMTEQETEV